VIVNMHGRTTIKKNSFGYFFFTRCFIDSVYSLYIKKRAVSR
jgi:hypothetical protein